MDNSPLQKLPFELTNPKSPGDTLSKWRVTGSPNQKLDSALEPHSEAGQEVEKRNAIRYHLI